MKNGLVKNFKTFEALVVFVFLLSTMAQYSFADDLTDRWIREAMVSQDGQKFFELGHCRGYSMAAVQSQNEVLVNRVMNMLKVVDIDRIHKAIFTKLDTACPAALSREQRGACLSSQPQGMRGYLAGNSEASKASQGATVAQISQWQSAYCGKHIRY